MSPRAYPWGCNHNGCSGASQFLPSKCLCRLDRGPIRPFQQWRTLNACLQSGFETFPATRFHGTLHDIKVFRAGCWTMDSLVSALPTRERYNGLRRDDLPKTIRNSVIVAIAYYLGAELAFLIGTLSDRIFAPFWPPNVVLFCALLVTPLRRWWIFILAAFPAHIVAEARIGMPAGQLLVAFATNCSVAALNAFAVQRILIEPPWFGSIRKATAYVFITAFVSPALCSFGGAFVSTSGGGSIENYGLYWARWYASNALGSLTLGPIAMILLEGVKTSAFGLSPSGSCGSRVASHRCLHLCVRGYADHRERLSPGVTVSAFADHCLGYRTFWGQRRKRHCLCSQPCFDMAHAERAKSLRHRQCRNKRVRHAAVPDCALNANPSARRRHRRNPSRRGTHASA